MVVVEGLVVGAIVVAGAGRDDEVVDPTRADEAASPCGVLSTAHAVAVIIMLTTSVPTRREFTDHPLSLRFSGCVQCDVNVARGHWGCHLATPPTGGPSRLLTAIQYADAF